MNPPKNIINQIWFDFGEKLDKNHKLITKNNTPILDKYNEVFEYKLWTLESATQFVKINYPFYYSFFRKDFEYNIIKCDFFRYILMYHFGGLYMDLDFMILDAKKLNQIWLDNENIALFEEWYKSCNVDNTETDEGSLHNGVLFSKYAKEQFWIDMANKVVINSPLIHTASDVWKYSGTNLLRNMYMKYKNAKINLHPCYKCCPYKSTDKTNKKNSVNVLNEYSIPLKLSNSIWHFFTFDEVVQGRHSMFDDSYLVCVASNSLWNRNSL